MVVNFMKKRAIFILTLMPLFLMSCDSSSSHDNCLIYYPEYFEYYGLYDSLGTRLFAWKDDSQWYFGFMAGTSEPTFVDEVVELQENPCPLDITKDILKSYFAVDPNYSMFLIVVSKEPKQEELYNFVTKDSEYAYLYDSLDIPQWWEN